MSSYGFITPSSNSTADNTNYRDYELSNDIATGHMINGIDAVIAWSERCLKTQKQKYAIYGWGYGVDFDQYIGGTYSAAYVKSEVERDVTDALTVHPSIRSVSDFAVDITDNLLSISCTINTIWGGNTIAI